MATDATTRVPGLRFDERGKWIPFTPEEARIRGEALLAALDRLDDIDADDSLSDEVLRAIDSHRPDCPLFKDILDS